MPSRTEDIILSTTCRDALIDRQLHAARGRYKSRTGSTLGSLFMFTVNENFSQFASQYLVILLLKL